VKAAGFTLIELLAVIVILSMTAATVSVSLAAADNQAAILRAIAQCRELDALTRQAAETHGAPAVLRVRDDHNSLALEISGEQLAAVHMPSGSELKVYLQRDRPVRQIIFDRAGRSPDYTITLRQGDQPSVRGRGRVCGLTGFFIEEPGT
jgi:prepilin-type N-terminal cleavage/methylation domain-containing protein